MRIAHITATFPPYEAGGGRVCYHNALGLAQRGHEVHVYTGLAPGGEKVHQTFPFQLHRLRPLIQIGNAPLLPGLLALARVDIVHLHLPFIFGAELTWLATWLRHLPYVVTYHNDIIGEGRRGQLFALYMKTVLPPVIARAQKIAAVTLDHALHSRAAACFERRRSDLVEIPNGVDTDHFRVDPEAGASLRDRLAIPAGARVALFVGALDRAHHYRRVDLFLQAVAQIKEFPVYALVVGDGDMRATYQAQAAEIGVRALFTGKIAHPDLPAYYNAADIVVLPSQLQESFGMVLIEGMSCGKPVIASQLPGVRTVVHHDVDGLLVAPGDAAALAEALRAVLANPQRAQEMGKAGRAKVERTYTWTSITGRLEDLYTSVLGAH